jgi:hypothetical protein
MADLYSIMSGGGTRNTDYKTLVKSVGWGTVEECGFFSLFVDIFY